MFDDLSRDLPDGTEFVVLTDTNKFLYASIHSVLRTLLEAILLVIVVVYVFLQDIKSTLIECCRIIFIVYDHNVRIFCRKYFLCFSFEIGRAHV